MTQPASKKTQRSKTVGNDVASPHFRFPVRNEAKKQASKKPESASGEKHGEARLRFDEAHPQMSAPNLSASVIEQFVGWSQVTISTWKAGEEKTTPEKKPVRNTKTEVTPATPVIEPAKHFSNARDPFGHAINKSGPQRIASIDKSPREVTGKQSIVSAGNSRPVPKLVATPAQPGNEKRLGNGIRVRISKQGEQITSIRELPESEAASLVKSSGENFQISSIPLFPEPAWPFVSELLLGAGWPFISRLAEGMDRILTGRSRRILVTGVQRAVGTTTLALTLARWAAANGQKVLVVDADVQSAGLTRMLGKNPARSWPAVTRGKDFVQNGTIRSSKTGIAFATTGTIRNRQLWPPFILDRLGDLLESTGKLYDLVLIDAGPVNQIVAELTNCALLSSCAMVVSSGNASEEPMVQSAHRRLAELGAQRILAARNFSAQPLQRPAA